MVLITIKFYLGQISVSDVSVRRKNSTRKMEIRNNISFTFISVI